MKNIFAFTLIVVSTIVMAGSCQAFQGRGDRQGPPGGRGGERGPGGQRGGPDGQRGGFQRGGPGGQRGGPGAMEVPIITALDADKDGKISTQEMANAASALATLDKNSDGFLDRDEIMPARRERGGRGGRGGPGQGQGQGQGQGIPHAGGPGGGMLSSSLISTFDGIVGYWDGMALRNPPPLGTTDADASYLSAGVRSRLLDSMLFPEFVVEGDGTEGHTTLRVRGNRIVKINRPSRAVFKQQLPMVRAYSDLRNDRFNEILIQTNDLLSFYGALGYLSANRHSNTLATMYTTQRVAVHVEMPIKHFCRSARPIDFAAHIQPMIQTPDHSSYPSGHATEVFAASTVFARLMTGLGPLAALSAPPDDEKGRLAGMAFRLALRIATNRSVAGVHFPVDSAAGAVAGCLLGEAMYRVATGATDWTPMTEVTFDTVPESDPPFDLSLGWLRDQLPADAATAQPDETTLFGNLWKKSADEWAEPEITP